MDGYFFFNDTATTEIYTLSLHDALPIFATRLVGEMEDVARTTRNPHRQAGFRVLRAHDIPSVLVELGYLSSRKDFDLLVSDEWRDKATAAMVTAVDRFFATRLARRGAAAVSP